MLGSVQARCCKVIEETQVEPLLVLREKCLEGGVEYFQTF